MCSSASCPCCSLWFGNFHPPVKCYDRWLESKQVLGILKKKVLACWDTRLDVQQGLFIEYPHCWNFHTGSLSQRHTISQHYPGILTSFLDTALQTSSIRHEEHRKELLRIIGCILDLMFYLHMWSRLTRIRAHVLQGNSWNSWLARTQALLSRTRVMASMICSGTMQKRQFPIILAINTRASTIQARSSTRNIMKHQPQPPTSAECT